MPEHSPGTRDRLEELTRRWRERHDRRAAEAAERPQAEADRESLARRSFPYRQMTPDDYVDRHGETMTGFTYDDYRYTDLELEAWLAEVGRLLRARRR
jgi:hypothetical protein